MEAHVHGLKAFAGDVVGDDAMCCGVVGLHGRGRLLVAHFFERVSGGNGLAAVDEEGGEFGFCSGGHDGFDDLGDCHNNAIARWSGGIAGHEKVSARSTPRF